MSINSFCNGCKHRKIPESIKQKFNNNVKVMFDECPFKDKKVVGCFVKDIVVDWKSFSRWLEDNNMFSEDERKGMKMLKLYEEKDA